MIHLIVISYEFYYRCKILLWDGENDESGIMETMKMYEISNVWQRDPDLRKRWFTTEDCDIDLYVWEHVTNGEIVHFQFYYDKNRSEKMVEWKGMTLNYASVDDGGAFGFYKSSPVLIRVDRMNLSVALHIFQKHSADVDESIQKFIIARFQEGLQKAG